MKCNAYQRSIALRDKLAQPALEAVSATYRGDPCSYTVHSAKPSGGWDTVIVIPSKNGKSALVSWFYNGRPIGSGVLSLVNWYWTSCRVFG